METYIQEDRIQTKEQLIDFCTSYLFHNLVRGDAIIIQEAYTAALEKDVDKLLYLEQLCGHPPVSTPIMRLSPSTPFVIKNCASSRV